jgi:aspartate carbamoyltransferase catalytic subunit
MEHVLRVEQFERDWILDTLLPVVVQLEQYWPDDGLAGVEIFNLFQQPSFLTRLAFARAVRRWGGSHEQAEIEDAVFAGAAVEGRRQSIEDEVRILNGLEYDAIVVRSAEVGGAERAAAVSRVPVINAGEPAHRATLGSAQHPTQALTDLATIEAARDGIDDLRIAIVPGDGSSLVIVQSLAMLLGRVCKGLQVDIVARPALRRLYDDVAADVIAQGARCEVVGDLRTVAGQADVLYFAQANNLHLGQAERYRDAGEEPGVYVLTDEVLASLRQDALILHPLPRNVGAGPGVVEELPERFSADPRVRIFEQARMKHLVAGALLWLLLAGRSGRA